jgi:tight adherence protein B
MLAIIAILVFVAVALGVFVVASLMDQRSAQARLLRERLASVQEAAERAPNEELALLRDEMLSKIPALDTLLRRSTRISNLQPFLEQANLKIRAGNILMLCVVSAVALALAGFLAAGSLPPNQALLFAAVGLVLGGFLPYSYASYRRTKRFQKFEELFPEAIDTLARAVRAGHA